MIFPGVVPSGGEYVRIVALFPGWNGFIPKVIELIKFNMDDRQLIFCPSVKCGPGPTLWARAHSVGQGSQYGPGLCEVEVAMQHHERGT